MIRRLEEADRQSVVALLRKALHLNLYMLGNLESLGFNSEISEFWGDFDLRVGEEERLRGVLNRYLSGWVVYGEADASWSEFAQVIDEHPVTAEKFQDNPGGIASLLPFLRQYDAASIDEEELMVLAEADFQPVRVLPGVEVRRAEMADLAHLIPFYADAGHMSRSASMVERPLRDNRIWMALVDGEPAATALTNAETDAVAMIGGVYTGKKWRNRGLSKAVCSALCEELLAEGKQPVLYWKNEAAGRVYNQLGFKAVGVWRSVRLQLRPGNVKRQ
jgi:uncharacterized protein